MTLLSIEQPPYVTLGTKNEYFSSVSTCVKLSIKFQARARTQVGFRKSGLYPLPGRPRPTGHLPKAPKAQWALRGGLAGPWGCFFNETACRFHSIEAKCGFPRWCGYVWAVRAGQTGPGGDGGPWGSHVSYPSRHGRPLRSQVTTGGLNGLCVVVQYTPHAGQSVPMLDAPQMNACGPPAADPTPPDPRGT